MHICTAHARRQRHSEGWEWVAGGGGWPSGGKWETALVVSMIKKKKRERFLGELVIFPKG